MAFQGIYSDSDIYILWSYKSAISQKKRCMVCYGFRANQHSTRSGWPPFALGSDADRSEMHHFGQGMSHKPSVRQHPRRNGTAKVAPPWRWEWLHELFLLPRQLIWSPWGGILAFYLTFYQAFYLTSLLTFYLTFHVTSCTRNWGPAVPTRSWGPPVPAELWRSPLRSGSAHWHLALAVEVRQCHWALELAVARSSGAPVPTEIWLSQLKQRRRRRWAGQLW